MGCEELRRLLAAGTGETQVDLEVAAAHLRGCPDCARGIDRLALELLSEGGALTCAGAQALFPGYYEATQQDVPLLSLTARERIMVALHLGGCASCREQFAVFCGLSRAEEE